MAFKTPNQASRKVELGYVNGIAVKTGTSRRHMRGAEDPALVNNAR